MYVCMHACMYVSMYVRTCSVYVCLRVKHCILSFKNFLKVSEEMQKCDANEREVSDLRAKWEKLREQNRILQQTSSSSRSKGKDAENKEKEREREREKEREKEREMARNKIKAMENERFELRNNINRLEDRCEALEEQLSDAKQKLKSVSWRYASLTNTRSML